MSLGKRILHWSVILLVLAGWLYIAARVPYTHDDWDWGLPIGLERWLSGQLNNRYAGTLLVLSMTRSPQLKTGVIAGSMVLIPLLIGRLAGKNDPDRRFFLFLITTAALLTTPMTSWQQTIGWVSAFANFVAAAVVMLLVLLLWQRAFTAQETDGPVWQALLLLVLCTVVQFFAENLTVVMVAAGAVCAGWSLWSGRGRMAALCSLAGCLLGGVLMFHNPLYGELATSGEAVSGVRSLIVTGEGGLPLLIKAAGERLFGVVLPWLFEHFPAVTMLVSVGCVWRLIRRHTHPLLTALVGLWMLGYSLQGWVVMEELRRFDQWQCPWQALRVWGAVLQLLLLFGIIVTERGDRRPTWLLLLLAAVGMILPFALVQDRGARCVFVAAMVLLLLGASLLEDLPCPIPLQGAAAAALMAGMVFHLHVYMVIGDSENLRQRLMAQAVAEGASSVLLPTEGWDKCYTWQRNPLSPIRATYFRQFYGLPEDMELIFLPPGSSELWPEIPPVMEWGATHFPPEA